MALVKRTIQSERGIGIVENMVAMAILAIALVGSVSIMTTSLNADKASRTDAALVADAQKIIDAYRQEDFTTLIARFGTDISSIANNAVVTETSTSKRARATYTARLTALKSRSTGIPDGVKVNVTAVQRRGKLKNRTIQFETMIANVVR